MWMILAFASALFAGITAILAKCGIKNMDSNVATALRTIVVLIFSWLLVFITGSEQGLLELAPRTFAFLVLSGLATGASWLCYFRALQLGDINKVTPIDKSSTVLSMLLAWGLLGEQMTWIKVSAMLLMGSGTYLMIQKQEKIQKEEMADCKGQGKAWLVYALGAAVFASLTSILGKIGVEGVDSNLGTAIRTIVVLIMAWLMVFITGKQHTILKIDTKSWLFLVLSGIATGASWLCYYRALQTGPASVVVPIDKLSILVTITFSYVVFKEKLNKKSAAGLVLIVVGTLVLLI